VTRSRVLPLLVIAAALALTALAAWRLSSGGRSTAEPRPPEEAAALPTPDASDRVEVAPLPRQAVRIYYPGIEWNGLVGEEREIFGTAAAGDRAKQILSDLIGGPVTPQATRALPPGTQLHQVYVLGDGTAWVDFSSDLRDGIGGGSSRELLTVYAIVDSIALNVPEIKKVGILINGRPVETLNGHLDLRRPLPPDTAFIVDETRGGGEILVRALGRR